MAIFTPSGYKIISKGRVYAFGYHDEESGKDTVNFILLRKYTLPKAEEIAQRVQAHALSCLYEPPPLKPTRTQREIRGSLRRDLSEQAIEEFAEGSKFVLRMTYKFLSSNPEYVAERSFLSGVSFSIDSEEKVDEGLEEYDSILALNKKPGSFDNWRFRMMIRNDSLPNFNWVERNFDDQVKSSARFKYVGEHINYADAQMLIRDLYRRLPDQSLRPIKSDNSRTLDNLTLRVLNTITDHAILNDSGKLDYLLSTSSPNVLDIGNHVSPHPSFPINPQVLNLPNN